MKPQSDETTSAMIRGCCSSFVQSKYLPSPKNRKFNNRVVLSAVMEISSSSSFSCLHSLPAPAALIQPVSPVVVTPYAAGRPEARQRSSPLLCSSSPSRFHDGNEGFLQTKIKNDEASKSFPPFPCNVVCAHKHMQEWEWEEEREARKADGGREERGFFF